MEGLPTELTRLGMSDVGLQDSNKCCLQDLWRTGIWDKSFAIAIKVQPIGKKNLLQTNNHFVRYLPELTYYIIFLEMIDIDVNFIYLSILSGNFKVKVLSINSSLVIFF